MPLTTRLNGTGAPNLITSAWFNDFKDLLTNVMRDQNIVVNNNITVESLGIDPVVSGLTATPAAGAGLNVGLYYYAVTYTSADGESGHNSVVSLNTTSGNQQGALSNIPTGPSGTVGRNIYRTVVGGSGDLKLVTTISDNTTTSYTDFTSDGSLGVGIPNNRTFGGSFIVKDSSGGVVMSIGSDGVIVGSTLYNALLTGAASLDSGTITTDGNGNLLFNAGNTITLRHSGISDATINTTPGGSNFAGSIYFQTGHFGVKNGSGVKLMEAKNNGNFIIGGSQYQTSAGSISTVSGQSFDSFDVAEVYESDQEYPAGTVLCPGNNNKLVKCTHDGCPCALVVSPSPGLLLGATHDDSNTKIEGRVAVALAGRVLVKTAMMMSPRTFVTTDGRGAIRPMQPGEEGYSLGFTLNETFVDNHVPQVGIFIRPAFVRVPK